MKIFFVKCQKGEKSVLPTFEKPIWTLIELIKMKFFGNQHFFFSCEVDSLVYQFFSMK